MSVVLAICRIGRMYVLVLPPSLGSARFWLELWAKKLGSARAISQKARIEKNWQNEPIDSTHQNKPICTLEYMVWPIRTSRNLLLKKTNKRPIGMNKSDRFGC